MAISIGANFSYNGKLFIDDRQGLAKTKSELKNWDLVVPEGFEVFLESDKEWYMFGSENNDPETGKFVKRNGKNDGECSSYNSYRNGRSIQNCLRNEQTHQSIRA